MTENERGYSHAATILQVKDVSASIQFYVDKLGFDCSFEWEDPPSYAVLNYKDRISIHLSRTDGEIDVENRARLSFFVFDVDAVYRDLIEKGVAVQTDIGTRDYGMRDFDILDNSGYLITFGTHVSRVEG